MSLTFLSTAPSGSAGFRSSCESRGAYHGSPKTPCGDARQQDRFRGATEASDSASPTGGRTHINKTKFPALTRVLLGGRTLKSKPCSVVRERLGSRAFSNYRKCHSPRRLLDRHPQASGWTDWLPPWRGSPRRASMHTPGQAQAHSSTCHRAADHDRSNPTRRTTILS